MPTDPHFTPKKVPDDLKVSLKIVNQSRAYLSLFFDAMTLLSLDLIKMARTLRILFSFYLVASQKCKTWSRIHFMTWI